MPHFYVESNKNKNSKKEMRFVISTGEHGWGVGEMGKGSKGINFLL